MHVSPVDSKIYSLPVPVPSPAERGVSSSRPALVKLFIHVTHFVHILLLGPPTERMVKSLAGCRTRINPLLNPRC